MRSPESCSHPNRGPRDGLAEFCPDCGLSAPELPAKGRPGRLWPGPVDPDGVHAIQAPAPAEASPPVGGVKPGKVTERLARLRRRAQYLGAKESANGYEQAEESALRWAIRELDGRARPTVGGEPNDDELFRGYLRAEPRPGSRQHDKVTDWYSKEIAKLRRALEDEHRQRLAAETARKKLEDLRDGGDPWFWQGDGNDDLGSLCSDEAVLITASDLRGLVASAREPLDRGEPPPGCWVGQCPSDTVAPPGYRAMLGGPAPDGEQVAYGRTYAECVAAAWEERDRVAGAWHFHAEPTPLPEGALVGALVGALLDDWDEGEQDLLLLRWARQEQDSTGDGAPSWLVDALEERGLIGLDPENTCGDALVYTPKGRAALSRTTGGE